MDEAGVTQTARQQVEETVRGQTDAVRQAVAAAVEQEVSAQVQEALRADVESQVLASMGLTAEDLARRPPRPSGSRSTPPWTGSSPPPP